ncbi:Predicted transcriptional regulator [Filimonas lacunae]|uniref:Predicted transcriptional regulator n=1 Tax=Filimonas lacunae TaxID=477680 RepID=A0A173ME19_9BACT|nr:BlaI/MecI/CopY family transcriptional regulator [Filimonas lacunae]BAV05681.1 transcriptional regulator, MecI family [Filimonas lacunae]SIT28919.1 Predicted transcriptional regulator [Filimonas lacunae]
MKTLTKAEEQVMQVLWKQEKGFLKDLVDAMPEPKPHSNTVATLLKILVEKQFVSTETIGRMHLYTPLVTKEAYSQSSLSGLVKGYFEGSYSKAVSFLIEDNKLTVEDLELLLTQLKHKNNDND